jgi:hypothetical protein
MLAWFFLCILLFNFSFWVVCTTKKRQKKTMILKAACFVLIVTVLALLSLIVLDDQKVCFDYGRLKDKMVSMVVDSETVPVE